MKNRNLWRVLMVLLLALPMMTVSAQTFNEDVTNPSATKIKTWSTALEALFADRACSQLNETYAAYTSAQMQADANWQALPGTLQKMVLKMVAGGTWSEDNVDSTKPAWDAEYAKRLRVQLIEPYNDPGNAAAALTMNAHTNLNNPLGIYGNNKQVLYIMVEGEVKTGSTLYLATWTGHGKPGNGVSEGTQLKPGLNVVTLTADGTTGCINYVVQTLDNSKGNGNKARVRKLSDYADLKVHVEGGILNGFYNAVGDELWGEGDNNADWDYYAARATHADLTVLGKYMTLQFPLHDELTEGNKGLGYYFTGKNTAEAIVEVWDNVMLWERLLMGLASKQQYSDANAKWKSPYSDKSEVFAYTGDNEDPFFCDYEDYYNVHGLAFGVGGTSYMYGSWDHSGYHYNTMGSIMGDIINSSGSYWGPGHEIGHQHQQPFTLNGLTEVTNNLFSNVVLWYVGKSTSRVNGDQGALFQVYDAFCTKGGDFYTNNIWALTHMYYRLFLYYHVLGHNTDFYPRLYEMLRQDPMKKSYNQDGAVGLLHFYKKACMAAGEDLTEFFRAHGMLEVMESRFVGDYANSIYNTTQQQVDAAIAEVKALGYKENLSVLFINDGTGEKITGCTGQELSLFDGATTANVGSYAYFYTPAADYTYTISNGKITMKGTGGVGYLVLNEAGEIVAFSNKKTFTITDDVAYLLMTGKAAVQAINGDNTTVPATTDMTTLQRNLLNTLLTKAKAMAKLSDDTGMKVGYYKSSTLTP
ncbi:MAG: M60 family metallopeptidase, partial [Bacteroidaceae bacterium]|nr:M60 family metallopeptidase [Bacteroidaceae bacterium]